MQADTLGGNNNNKNIDFYNNIGVDPFKIMAEIGGFDSFVDLELAYEYIKNTKSVVELGAGYGRCIDFLIKKKYKGKIYAVEYSHILALHLNDNYTQHATILQQDIKKLKLPSQVDIALWMWSGFIDFTEIEQQNCIEIIYSQLNEGGKIIMDLPRFGVQTFAQHTDKQHIHFESPYGNLDCFIPNLENIENYAHKAGFKKVTFQDYKTDTDKERSLYVLFK